MTRLLPLAALTVCAALTACGRSDTPQGAATSAKTLNVTLNGGSQGDQPWSAGAGTFAIYPAHATFGSAAIASSSVSAAGKTTLTLPGSAEGIESKTSVSPKSGLASLGVNCTSTALSETAPSAKALYLDEAAFSSAQGGAPISEYTVTATGSMVRYPVYITQDDTVTGQMTCGLTYAVNLPFRRGWNVMIVINDTTGTTSSIGLDTSGALHYAVR